MLRYKNFLIFQIIGRLTGISMGLMKHEPPTVCFETLF